MKSICSSITRRTLILSLCSLVACTIIAGTWPKQSQAETYRWQDEQGNPVFGDTPPKGKDATVITIENTQNSGAQFADPGLVNDLEKDVKARRKNPANQQQHVDSHCRQYVSQLNKIEIYLEHTPTQRDQQKALDLRKLIEKECNGDVLSLKHSDWQCKRYRQDLNKTRIYLEHTPSDRDAQRIKDLREQIARECQ